MTRRVALVLATWLALSSLITPATVAAYSVPRRLWQNLLARWSPLL